MTRFLFHTRTGRVLVDDIFHAAVLCMTRQWGELYPDCYGEGQSPINLTPGVETKKEVRINDGVSHSHVTLVHRGSLLGA